MDRCMLHSSISLPWPIPPIGCSSGTSPLWLNSTFFLSHVVVLHLHGLFQAEDAALLEGIELHGAKKMKMVAEFVGTRNPNSCRMSSKTHQLPEIQTNNVPSSCVHVHVCVFVTLIGSRVNTLKKLALKEALAGRALSIGSRSQWHSAHCCQYVVPMVAV
jgi:hypothetical protein